MDTTDKTKKHSLSRTGDKSSGEGNTQWHSMRADQAKSATRKRHLFDVEEDLPVSRHIILIAIAAFFVIFVTWANYAALDEVTRGRGKVVPSSEVQTLQSLEGGIVEAFLVKEGDDVKAGEPVLRLRDIQASSDFESRRQKYLGLRAKVARLQAEAEGRNTPDFPQEVMQEAPKSVQEQMEVFRANRANVQSQVQVLEERLNQRRQEIDELTTRVTDLEEVIRLSREEMRMIEPLVRRGSAPKVELIQLERAMTEKQGELNSVQNSLPRKRSAVQEARARIREISSAEKAKAQTELSATMIELNSLKEELSALRDRKVRTEITSPVNGTIKDIKVNTVGGVVKPGEDLVEIVPRDDQLIVQARVRPADIAFLHPGQPAVIKLTAYDYSIYGGLKGELIDISADTMTNEDNETFYRIKVRTDQTHLNRRGQKYEIIPGMVASVDILTGEKTVMQYILKPLIKTLDGAMNER